MKKNIKFLVTDVDGTLTDGKIYMGETGEVMKAFDVRDGAAFIEILPKYNILPIIITGRESPIVGNRAKQLGIKLVFQGIGDKLTLLKKIAEEHNVTLEEVAYIGDDLNDLDCMKACGYTGCPENAVDVIKENADYISTKPGGSGAVRDFIEHLVAM